MRLDHHITKADFAARAAAIARRGKFAFVCPVCELRSAAQCAVQCLVCELRSAARLAIHCPECELRPRRQAAREGDGSCSRSAFACPVCELRSAVQRAIYCPVCELRPHDRSAREAERPYRTSPLACLLCELRFAAQRAIDCPECELRSVSHCTIHCLDCESRDGAHGRISVGLDPLGRCRYAFSHDDLSGKFAACAREDAKARNWVWSGLGAFASSRESCFALQNRSRLRRGAGSGKRAARQNNGIVSVSTLYPRYAAHLDAILDTLGLPPGQDRRAVTVEPPRDASHGDLATNAAMVLAKGAGQPPRQLAEAIAAGLRAVEGVDAVDVAGPGFINMRLSDAVWRGELALISSLGSDYGKATPDSAGSVNVEFVSANPTGPMHMGHCRGAVVGDALATLLQFAGHKVTREYYVNDAGGQVDVLARSVHLRYREALGEAIGAIPQGLYPGDYLVPVSQKLAAEHGPAFVDKPESDWLVLFRETAVAAMMDMIRSDLALLGIHHDVFASEAAVQFAKKPEAAEAFLRARDLVYDGVLEAPKGEINEDWEPVEMPLFRSSQFGDDQDRPIKKSNGAWTYFGADMAYHFQKAEKADALINIWGADHSGTVKRIKAAVAALTEGRVPLDIKLIQMVRLMRNGELVRMGKRLGNFVTLADVVEEVGKDVVRFTMLTRKPDAQMDFDFAKVVEASKDNPVFYVQYAHARICSTARKIAEAGIAGEGDPALLDGVELDLVKLAAQFPRIVESAAANREPHRIAFYLYDLAAAFHAFYNLGNDSPERRILVVNNPLLTLSRLSMAHAIGQVIANGLSIMGVTPAQEM